MRALGRDVGKIGAGDDRPYSGVCPRLFGIDRYDPGVSVGLLRLIRPQSIPGIVMSAPRSSSRGLRNCPPSTFSARSGRLGSVRAFPAGVRDVDHSWVLAEIR